MNLSRIILLVIVQISSSLNSQTKQDLENQKKQIQQDIKKIELKLKTNSKQKKLIVSNAEDINYKIKLQQNLINNINSQLNLILREIDRNENRLNDLKQRELNLKDELSKMLLSAYKKKSNLNKLMFVFSSTSFQQAYKRIQGYVYSYDEIKTLVEIVKKHNLFLISDEVYREFTYDNVSHKSIMQFDDIKQHAIVIDSVSKRYSMCGARIGCIISKNSEFISTAMKFAQARLSPPTLAQIASTAAMDTGVDYFDKVINEYDNRRITLVEGLYKIPGVKVSEPKGAFYCVVELPVDNSEHFAKWLLEEYSLDNETIMDAPAAGF